MTLRELMTSARTRLAGHFGDREAWAMVDEMLLRIKGWDRVATILRASDEASDFLVGKVDNTVSLLLDDCPIQYIFGCARFYGMDFKVDKSTLIPRPETAALVDIIVDRYAAQSDLRVLDIGTGSGCIAIALARNLPFSAVTAVDISADALNVARENAKTLRAKVDFRHADILNPGLSFADNFDIIVSNPPYITQSEASQMHRNVLDNEPHSALFVPDDDPLLFYRAIAHFARRQLNPQGALFFEINSRFGDATRSMMVDLGFTNVEVYKDIHGLDRFVVGLLS